MTEIIVLFVLIVLNAFFAASEIALISLNDNKVKTMAEEGHPKMQMLQSLLSEPSRFLATIQIGITLAGFMASAFAAEKFAGQLAEFLMRQGVPLSRTLLGTLSVALITLILSYFTLVFGELVPKRLAMRKAELIAMFAVRPLTVLSVITAPFVKLLTLSTNLIVRLFGVDPHEQDEQVTEEEIRMMVDLGKERGTIQETEKIMINNVFEFNNKTVSEIMTHRTHIIGIPVHYSLREMVRLIQEEKFTRFPVYEERMDNIVGLLHVKDILPFIEDCDGDSFDLLRLIRKPLFIPSSRKTDEAFRDLQKHKVHMAIVLDEYGGTAGIVTIEDLIEEIVGNIFDEYDEEEKEILKLDEQTYLMQGMIDLDTVANVLDVELPLQEYDTLSGFLIGQLGRIPGPDDHSEIEFNDVLFKVEEADDKKIVKVKVYRVG
ncbi:HlyC/CorC family transporter [Xylanibacillus composti]|uniref:HlyC/CorC family transporter n=1 Tax=Xylanibacillus composti TaxID=1572762 RepID=A0A8J4H2R2_9BACL|nr:hemolysin family protein [Xylanibacillus composti]MDT9725753.1 HlyC/CorC family transporter [Xylanibacillus composti]GIQ67533.1 hypothetical protein XYCOK13_03570 [Xylanibacillus composti]